MSQLPQHPLHFQEPMVSRRPPPVEVGPSKQRLKKPCLDQLWHGNLQDDAQVLLILLQRGSVEPGGREVFFEGCYEGLKKDHFYCMVRPMVGSRGHQQWLQGPVNHLPRMHRTTYVTQTLKKILEFLEMGKI